MAEEKDGLRDAIEMAFDEHKETETEQPQQDSDEAPEKETIQESEVKEKTETEGESVQAQQAQTKSPQSVTPPVFWGKDDKAEFAKLPPRIQERIALREKQRDQYTDRLVSTIQRERKLYEGLNEVFNEERIKSLRVDGLTPVAATQRLWAWHDLLESDPIKGIAALAQRYGVDMGQLSGVEVEQGEDSKVEELEKRIEQMKAQQEQEKEESQVSLIRSQLDQFAQERDEKGNPLRPYFNDLKPVIRQLLPLIYQETPGISDYDALHQAYERAAYASPQVRQNLLQKPTRPNDADAVRKASATLTGSPSPGATSSPRAKSVRDALRFAAAKHGVEI